MVDCVTVNNSDFQQSQFLCDLISPGHLIDLVAGKVAPRHAVKEVRIGVVIEGDLRGAPCISDALEGLEDVLLVGGVEKAISHGHLGTQRQKSF